MADKVSNMMLPDVDAVPEGTIISDLCGFDTNDPSYDWVSELADGTANPKYKGKVEELIAGKTPNEFALALIAECAKSPKNAATTILMEGAGFSRRADAKLDSVAIRIRRSLTDKERRSPEALLNLTSLVVRPIHAGTALASGKTVPVNCVRITYTLTADQVARLAGK